MMFFFVNYARKIIYALDDCALIFTFKPYKVQKAGLHPREDLEQCASDV